MKKAMKNIIAIVLFTIGLTVISICEYRNKIVDTKHFPSIVETDSIFARKHHVNLVQYNQIRNEKFKLDSVYSPECVNTHLEIKYGKIAMDTFNVKFKMFCYLDSLDHDTWTR